MDKKKSLRTIIENEFEMKLKDFIMVLFAIIVSSAIFGFIYEVLFYRIDLGYFVKRGTTFGPWIPIYGFGGLFITLLTHHFKKKPINVFLLSVLISGILEFATGYVLFHMLNVRLWDYNVEIWNWGNIGGYICARSVLFFGVSGLMLMYGILPLTKKVKEKTNPMIFNTISTVLCLAFFADMIISNFIIK